jgi:heptosyltransferase-2
MPGALEFRDIGYRKTAGVLRHCDLLVTHVGGIMHLAAALRVPAVVLYGAAEHPAISGYPWNRNVYIPIECGPCWMRDPCSHLSCMRRLTPEMAMAEVRTAVAGMSNV